MNNGDHQRVDASLAGAVQRIGGESPRLDAERLLAFVTGRTPTWFRTWPEHRLTDDELRRFADLIEQRVAGAPIAYLVGAAGFWLHLLQTSEHTLIPRPDTECLVEAALSLALPEDADVIDLGTGTGAIALALAGERTGWHVSATDLSDEAAATARLNAEKLGLNITIRKSHWFRGLSPAGFDLIVSNPPYIASNDKHLDEGDVRFEPRSALVSGDDGLDAICEITTQAPRWLNSGGWLLLEHGFDQAEAVRDLFYAAGFESVCTGQDYGGNDRFTLGQLTQDMCHA